MLSSAIFSCRLSCMVLQVSIDFICSLKAQNALMMSLCACHLLLLQLGSVNESPWQESSRQNKTREHNMGHHFKDITANLQWGPSITWWSGFWKGMTPSLCAPCPGFLSCYLPSSRYLTLGWQLLDVTTQTLKRLEKDNEGSADFSRLQRKADLELRTSCIRKSYKQFSSECRTRFVKRSKNKPVHQT